MTLMETREQLQNGTSTPTGGPNGNRIGRANLCGSGINGMFITTTVPAAGVAVAGNFIYRANSGLNSIGRANIADGSGANQLWITGAANPQGVTVNSAFIYWVNASYGRIGRQPQRHRREPIFHHRRQAGVDRRRPRKRLVDE